MKYSYLALALSATLLSACSTEQTADISNVKLRPVKVVSLSAATQANNSYYNGVLQSSTSSKLAFRVPGTIQEILVSNGQSVTKGQVLARLDPHDYQVSLLELEAKLLEAESAQALAHNEYQRVQQASQDNAIAPVNLNRALSGKQRADASVEVVNQNIQRAKDALRYTELRAPFDGVIAQRFAEEHEQAVPALRVFTLHQPEHLEAVIEVPENQINAFSIGQAAQVSWHEKTDSINAKVSEIATVPDLIKQTYTVKLKLEQTLDEVYPGKSVQLSLALSQSEQARYCLPHSALILEGAKAKVYRVHNHKVEAVASEIVNQTQQQVCVSGDFKEADKIIVAGSRYLSEGQQVGDLLDAKEG
ncbi:efflux RND transporter periplasmic adaptor subunit [Agarivorans sp. B2Z047]|uniref:efflux RND transporter periplasmic adaptor subunit n=1 Tax=Agarivorans sp. B2Z047 TaxID=2652721 RepID=UPI00128CA9D8|nr:efflux RND transporter periplasmic adaptor subunit [Agarivorans sp. B2Z047]MPW27920.1 efflux RND transporter periplasmic adaptor subunit [Agarivorans sp. B2Z047]UQN44244.1 efflux RND transporter periplasmic adaptor subunit [Agarivorans sp. B2Z047]